MNRFVRKCGPPSRAAVFMGIVLIAATVMVEPAYTQDMNPESPQYMNPESPRYINPSIQEESVNASCYKGDIDAGNYIGSITVTSSRTAGQICNSIYYDCRGKCLGCFTDSRGMQVCYDSEGRKK